MVLFIADFIISLLVFSQSSVIFNIFISKILHKGSNVTSLVKMSASSNLSPKSNLLATKVP